MPGCLVFIAFNGSEFPTILCFCYGCFGDLFLVCFFRRVVCGETLFCECGGSSFMSVFMKHRFKLLGLLCAVLFIFYGMNSCVGVPDGVSPVDGFDQDKYMGKWYEIARLDHSFERGLSEVSAEYSSRDGGGIKVLNRGYNESKGEWSEAEGKAYFVGAADVGHLKVSFFGPFYGSYVVFDLDKAGYQHAYITSYNKKYLWFLSRTPQVSDDKKRAFIEKAKGLGYDVDALIFVDHKARKK